jgi:serine/threonine-protein kinase HipA
MKKILAYYNGWGEHWHLGTLAHGENDLLFEYSPEAIKNGLELSPPNLRLRAEAYGGFPKYLQRLPGLIADSLPDGWGLLVMDRDFQENGINPATLSPLDRLAFLGSRTMGALTFEPADDLKLATEDVKLLELAAEAETIVKGKDTDALHKLALMGGSPQGARPKVLVHYNKQNGAMSTAPVADTQPWLVKFQARDEHKEACALEDLYAQLARECGLDVPETHYFDLSDKLAGFGIARFDVEDGMRVPIHTLAGMLHADYSIPSIDYNTFLRATRTVTRDEREVQRAYERAAFNVVFHNRDDHSKNFSFRLGRDRNWRLAPCYDLTFSEGPGGEHQMAVCGEARNITRTQMLDLAKLAGLDTDWAKAALDKVVERAGRFKELAATRPVRRPTVKKIVDAIEANRKRVA